MKLCFRFTYCGLHRVVKLRFLKLFGRLSFGWAMEHWLEQMATL